MKYKLLVLDLDGTLTNSKKVITEHTRTTLIEAQKRGLKIVLASGRPTYGVVPLANQLELDKYEGYILSYNGGEIIDWKTGEMMYKNLLDPEVLPYLYLPKNKVRNGIRPSGLSSGRTFLFPIQPVG